MPKIQMRMFQYKGSGNIRLKVKKRQRQLLVYVDGWAVQKNLLHEQKLQKPLEKLQNHQKFQFSNLPVDSRFKFIHF